MHVGTLGDDVLLIARRLTPPLFRLDSPVKPWQVSDEALSSDTTVWLRAAWPGDKLAAVSVVL
jgi:hypothetical protein